jgi:ketosteroid isomerase-like protein
MSRGNVEVVRRFLEAFNRRDFDAANRYVHPEIELYPALEGPDITPADIPLGGRDNVRGFLEAISEPWQEMTVTFEEIKEAPGERVLGVERWHTRGRDGVELNTMLIDVYSFREGLIARVDGFTDRDEAFEAAGLSE